MLAGDIGDDDSEALPPEAPLFVEDDDRDEAISHDEEIEELEAEEEGASLLFDVAPFANAAAAVSTDPSLDNIRHINELVIAAKKATGGATPQQTVILHLLESATTFIGQKSELDTEDQVVVQELAAGLELAADDPFELTALVHHYTAWQQIFFRCIMSKKGDGGVAAG
ncbi:MAG: hypothetical protein D3908_10585, partial [Candidatus Electrothrix sp. AUS4]|nr:hypothetical protein [Candidatus Electrothrix sp. AUS4]